MNFCHNAFFFQKRTTHMAHSSHYLKLALFVFIATLLQISILPRVWLFRIKPDLLLILVFLTAMNSRSIPEIVFLSLACGLVKDVFGIRLFGFNAITMSLLALGVRGIFQILNKELKGIKFSILILVTLINYAALTIIFARPYIIIGFLEAIVNCLFLPLVNIVYDFYGMGKYKTLTQTTAKIA